MKSLLAGAVRGAAATTVMTLPLLARWALRPAEPPPPMVVAENLQRKVGLEPRRYPRLVRHAAWATAHLGFGCTLGAAAQLWPRRASTPATAQAFALSVWSATYGTVLPVAGLYPALTRDNRLRAATSLLSHIVYGAALRRLASS
jgi:hypothetical protein